MRNIFHTQLYARVNELRRYRNQVFSESFGEWFLCNAKYTKVRVSECFYEIGVWMVRNFNSKNDNKMFK